MPLVSIALFCVFAVAAGADADACGGPQGGPVLQFAFIAPPAGSLLQALRNPSAHAAASTTATSTSSSTSSLKAAAGNSGYRTPPKHGVSMSIVEGKHGLIGRMHSAAGYPDSMMK